jgi:ankyrin repeat protein
MQTDFLAAVKQGETDKVLALLEQDGSLLTSQDEQGLSAILWSVYSMQPAVTALLLTYGPHLSLFEAAAVGDEPALRRHLAQEPEAVHRVASDGFSALGLAAFFGHVTLARHLLEAGADPSSPSRNKMQVTPLHSAVAHRDATTAQELTRLLLEHGADVDVAQQGGWTPLHQAAAHGRIEVLELLLARQAPLSALSADGRTPLDMARAAGHGAVVERLEQAAR